MRSAIAIFGSMLALLLCPCGSVRACQTLAPGSTAIYHERQEQGTPSRQTSGQDMPCRQDCQALEKESPLPGIALLMHQVEENQRHAETLEKNYVYRSSITQQQLDAHGQVKKITTMEADHFWLNGVPVSRIVRRNGKDLTPEELTKENERIEKEARKDRERRDKNQAAGKQTDAQGHEEITVSRFLSLGAFTNPRRVSLNGRAAIAVDYTGDPQARTKNRAEDAVRDLAGTVWVDEQDRVLARVEGRFVNAFKIGGGLVADVKKNTWFDFQQRKVNEELWLPARIRAEGAFRAMLFYSFSGQLEVVDSDYRKFRATATVLPDVAPAPNAKP